MIEMKDQTNRSINLNQSNRPSNEEFKLIQKIENKNLLEDNDNKFSITMKEHLISMFTPCLRNENSMQKDKIYDLILNHINEYTDILGFVHSITEI